MLDRCSSVAEAVKHESFVRRAEAIVRAMESVEVTDVENELLRLLDDEKASGILIPHSLITFKEGEKIAEIPCSISSGRLQEKLKREYQSFYHQSVKLDKLGGGSWEGFVTSALHLQCFHYSKDVNEKYPFLACYLSPSDTRCCKQGLRVADICQCDALIGKLLQDKYLRWNFLVPKCVKIFGSCIQDRSIAYGVPPFLPHFEFLVASETKHDESSGGNQWSLGLGDTNFLRAKRRRKTVYLSRDIFQPTPLDLCEKHSESSGSTENSHEHQQSLAPSVRPTRLSSGREKSSKRLKLFVIVREVLSQLLASIPILTALPKNQLREIIASIFNFTFSHDFSLYPSLRHPRKGKLIASLSKKENSRNRNHYYTCSALSTVVESCSSYDFKPIKVESLKLIYNWWANAEGFQNYLPEENEKKIETSMRV